jgi:hypothetical protein
MSLCRSCVWCEDTFVSSYQWCRNRQRWALCDIRGNAIFGLLKCEIYRDLTNMLTVPVEAPEFARR